MRLKRRLAKFDVGVARRKTVGEILVMEVTIHCDGLNERVVCRKQKKKN